MVAVFKVEKKDSEKWIIGQNRIMLMKHLSLTIGASAQKTLSFLW